MTRAKAASGIWIEAAFWLAALGLLSPLVVYAGRPSMPLAALFGIAAGIFVAIALIGRRIHDALVGDVLRGRHGLGRALLAVALALLAVFLVLVGIVFTLLMVARGAAPGSPV